MHIGTPSQQAQSAVYRKALSAAGIDANTVGMVEAHGPGTPVGDPIEYASLAGVYGIDGPCALASAKTNFGHTQSAAGVLGLMKTVLALQHGVVPKNLHFTRLPDELARIDTKLFVPTELSPWTTNGGQPRRAAVSAYGLSGTNVHGVLEQAPAQPPDFSAPWPGGGSADAGPLLFAVSSTSADELRRTADRLADWVSVHDDVALPDLAYTLARRREHRSFRAAVIASSRPQLAEALRDVAGGDARYEAASGYDGQGPVWVFSGQGSQWAGMGAQLLANEPVFAATVAQAEPVILRECGFSVTEAMSAHETVTGQERIQPTLFTMQVAMAATLTAHGARPGAVIGHSVGEVAAAVVAGALSLADGLLVVCRRAGLMSPRRRGRGNGVRATTGSAGAVGVGGPWQERSRGSRGAVPGVDGDCGHGVGGSRPGRSLGATRRDGPGSSHRRSVPLASGRPDRGPVHPIARGPQPHDAGHSLLFGDVLRSRARRCRAMPATGRPTCAAWSGSAAAVRAALEDGHRVFAEVAPHPLLTRAVEQNREKPRRAAVHPGSHAPRPRSPLRAEGGRR